MPKRRPKYVMPKFPPPRFRVGDRVRVTGYAWQGGIFEIVEDRGNVGVGGRRFYAIKATWADGLTEPFSFPEAELELAPEANHESATTPPSNKK